MLSAVAGRTKATHEFGRRWRHRGRVAEAVVLLALAAAAQRWLPMSRWARVLGRPAPVPHSWRGQRIDALASRAASLAEQRALRAVHRASTLVWWTPSCLAEAAAAQVLLRQQGEAGVVVIGLRPPSATDDAWATHAWLVGRHGAITGGVAAQGFTATAVFELVGRLRAIDVELDTADHIV